MGENIDHAGFSKSEFDEFKDRLRRETASLMQSFRDQTLSSRGKSMGLELETWLVDDQFSPAPDNDRFLQLLNRKEVVPELSRYNVEINSNPLPIDGTCLSRAEADLREIWEKITACAAKMNRKMMIIGSLPTLTDDMLGPASMSDRERYRALNQQIIRQRKEKPVHVLIEGEDTLDLVHTDVMLEAATTSMQLHLQAEPEMMARYYNASLIASSISAAVAANTPYLFRKSLWSESRIPLFEKSLQLPGFFDCDGEVIGRVTFGHGYVRQSLLEIFLENLDAYPVLLPVLFDEERERLKHLHLHNGSIWRWNRPIIETGSDGQPHLRVEHRVPAAGPTLADTVANAGLFLGLAHHLAVQEVPPESQLPFQALRRDFYEAARHGPDARIHWPGIDGTLTIRELLEDGLLRIAAEGLQDLGVEQEEADWYVGKIIGERIKNRRTGSQWQRQWMATRNGNFADMTEVYYENQQQNIPVGQWTL